MKECEVGEGKERVPDAKRPPLLHMLSTALGKHLSISARSAQRCCAICMTDDDRLTAFYSVPSGTKPAPAIT